jgi:thiamine pyrophosphokinase
MRIFGIRYKSILCLNGDVPQADFFDEKVPIIAADGAFNKLKNDGIVPNVVVGDLDSIDFSEVNEDDTEIVKIDDQDTCDFEKSIAYLKNFELLPTIIVGISGCSIDHYMNNLCVFSSLVGCVFCDFDTLGAVVGEGENLCIRLPFNTKVSLFGCPEADVTTSGLKWELSNSKLSFFKYNSCSNRTIGDETIVNTHSGKVIAVFHV